MGNQAARPAAVPAGRFDIPSLPLRLNSDDNDYE